MTPENVPSDSPKEVYEVYFVFACVWAFGGPLLQDQVCLQLVRKASFTREGLLSCVTPVLLLRNICLSSLPRSPLNRDTAQVNSSRLMILTLADKARSIASHRIALRAQGCVPWSHATVCPRQPYSCPPAPIGSSSLFFLSLRYSTFLPAAPV